MPTRVSSRKLIVDNKWLYFRSAEATNRTDAAATATTIGSNDMSALAVVVSFGTANSASSNDNSNGNENKINKRKEEPILFNEERKINPRSQATQIALS